ncbi:MAG: polysaccharide biosynthesis protein [Bacteroides sp.]|nr:polysaccharide biosynthesis protein [Bacteroides sp.]
MTSDDNKRIAKNTIFLYVRMLVSLAVSLYTSRVVLEVLGVSDYGIYNLVGGVVGVFGVLNASMSSATSRFLNFELGKEGVLKLKEIFSSAMVIHCAIALIVVIVAETIGLWFLNHKLIIPVQSMYAARWVYQLSILAAIISITQVPYNAVIMAEERMSVFAYFDIVGTFLKLGIVYLLLILPGYKLILYAILMALVSIGMMMVYRIYCTRHFKYCRLSLKHIDKGSVRPMLTFSGWDLYGNISVMARTQGVSILANMFFGTVINAAMGIANQVQGALNGFASNVTLALKPQIIKSYAAKNYPYMSQLLFIGAKYSFLIILLLGLPILIETPFVLQVWLKTVPEYTVSICRLSLVFVFFSNMSVVLVTGVHATGNIKSPSFINGSMYLSVLPISYIAYKLHFSVYIPFILNVIYVFIGAILNFYYTKRYVKILSLRKFLLNVVLRCLVVAILSAILPIVLSNHMQYGWFRFITVCVVSFSSTVIFSLLFAMNGAERQMVFNALSKFRRRITYGS